MKYRSRTDLIATLLTAANGGAAKTKIMYKSYLSYAQLKEYLIVLVQNSLVDFDPITQIYKTSERGMRFLYLYEKLGEFVESRETYEIVHSHKRLENAHAPW